MKIKVTYKINNATVITNFEGETQEQCKTKENEFFKNKNYELVERRWLN